MTQVIADARKLGALGTELLFVEDRGQLLEMEGSRVLAPTETAEARVALRVWLEGGREGRATGEPASVGVLVEQALLAASGADDDPHLGPSPRQTAVPRGLSLLDRRHSQLTQEDRAEVLVTAQRSASQGNARIATQGFRYRDRHRVRRFANSRGVALEEESTTYLAEGEVQVRASGGSLRVWDSIASRTFASIASLPYGTSLGRRATALLLDGPTLPAGPVRVLLPARVVAMVFASIAEGFEVSNLSDDSTFFLKPGAANALDSRLHLLDDGALPGGLRTRGFDDRGVASVPLTLLREGVVDGRFVDTASARQLGVRATGHEMGDHLRPSNLVLKSGTRSVNACLSDLGGQTLMVDAFGSLAGLDRATGDFEARVNGVVMDANRAVGSMRDVQLQGNLGVVLRQVVEVCSDTDRVGHVDAPALIVEGFEIIG